VGSKSNLEVSYRGLRTSEEGLLSRGEFGGGEGFLLKEGRGRLVGSGCACKVEH